MAITLPDPASAPAAVAPGPTEFRGVGSLWPGLEQAGAKVGRAAQLYQAVKERTEQLEDTAQEGKMLNEYREAAHALLLDPKWAPMEPRTRAEAQREALKDLSGSYTEKLSEKIVTPAVRARATTRLGHWTESLAVRQEENAQKEAVQWSLNQHEVDTEKNHQQMLAAPDADTRLDIVAEFTARLAALRAVDAITPGEEQHKLRTFLVQGETNQHRLAIEQADDPRAAYRAIIEQDTQRDPDHVLRLTPQARTDLFNYANAHANAKHNETQRQGLADTKAAEEASEANFTRLQAGLNAAYKAHDMGAVKALQQEAEALPPDEFTRADLDRFRSTDARLAGIIAGRDDPNTFKAVMAVAKTRIRPEDGEPMDRAAFHQYTQDLEDRGLLTAGSADEARGIFDATTPPLYNANDTAAVVGLNRDLDRIELDEGQVARAQATPAGVRRAMKAEGGQLFLDHRKQFPTSTPEESRAYAAEAVNQKYAPMLKSLDPAAFARDFPEQARGLDPDLPLSPQIRAMFDRGEFPRERWPEVRQYLRKETAERDVFRRKQIIETGRAAEKLAKEPGITPGQEFENTVRGWFGADPRYEANQFDIGRQLQAVQTEVQRLEGVEVPGLETPILLRNAKQRESELRAQLRVPEAAMSRMIALRDLMMQKDTDPTKRALLEAEWNALAVEHGPALGIPVPAAPAPGTAPPPAPTTPTERTPAAPAPAPGPISFAPEVETAITAASATHNVPADLVRAIVFEESRGDVGARNVVAGKEDSFGLMQINAVAHLSFDKSRALDPDYNVDFGVAFLASLLERHDGNVEKAVAAYNGSGPAARAYAKRVMARMARNMRAEK